MAAKQFSGQKRDASIIESENRIIGTDIITPNPHIIPIEPCTDAIHETSIDTDDGDQQMSANSGQIINRDMLPSPTPDDRSVHDGVKQIAQCIGGEIPAPRARDGLSVPKEAISGEQIDEEITGEIIISPEIAISTAGG